MTVRFPTTGAIAGDLYGMVLRELILCKTMPEETVVIFTDTRTNVNYAAAFLAGAKEVAGSAFEIKVPLLPNTVGRDTNVTPAVEILKTAHLVVDLTTGGVLYLYGKGLTDVLSGGTRVLQVRGTEDQLRRCFPDEAVRQRTLNGAQKLEQAEQIRIRTENGTDLSMRKDGRRGITQYGISDQPGRWDSWPSGFLYCAPLEDSANGMLVLDPGDLLVMLGRYVQEPVSITVRNGQITSVEGGVDAILLKEHLDQPGDPQAFMISHIGWGTDPRARWVEVAQRGTEEGARDARSSYGNVQIAFGANYALGGNNTTLAHEDLILRRAAFHLDGDLIVNDGRIIPEELR
jgi:2,5-dihydroxypyridine 5,6-dioxygenase